MSAAMLREATALMRERAEAALKQSGAPWDWADLEPSSQAEQRALGSHSCVHDGKTALLLVKGFRDERRALVGHVAGWHPAVALAVADWLDGAAGRAEAKLAHGGNESAVWSHELHALAVARAYLGQSAAGEPDDQPHDRGQDQHRQDGQHSDHDDFGPLRGTDQGQQHGQDGTSAVPVSQANSAERAE